MSKEGRSVAQQETPPVIEKITRDDLEAKFRQLTGEVEDRAESARSTAVTVGIVVGAIVVVGVFMLGRRRGRKSSTFVEVRRF